MEYHTILWCVAISLSFSLFSFSSFSSTIVHCARAVYSGCFNCCCSFDSADWDAYHCAKFIRAHHRLYIPSLRSHHVIVVSQFVCVLFLLLLWFGNSSALFYIVSMNILVIRRALLNTLYARVHEFRTSTAFATTATTTAAKQSPEWFTSDHNIVWFSYEEPFDSYQSLDEIQTLCATAFVHGYTNRSRCVEKKYGAFLLSYFLFFFFTILSFSFTLPFKRLK